MTHTYQQKAPHQDKNGKEISDKSLKNGSYLFSKNGKGFYWSTFRKVPISWEFSDDGMKLRLIRGNGAEVTYDVVELGDRHPVIDGVQSNDGFVRLVYTRKEQLKGSEIILNMEQEELLRKALEVQIHDPRNQVGSLECRLAKGGNEPRTAIILGRVSGLRGGRSSIKKGYLA